MNLLEIGLSFLEGLALIISPCILPVLPIILSASIEGGRKRPFGIILGFVTAFTAFALLSRKLVMWFNLDLDIIKYGSLLLLALFGFILISEKLSEKFSNMTERFANAGSNLSAKASNGFFSGIVIGLLIGIVWTPCAGPILAAVLVQVIRQESDTAAIFLLASFAFGAAMPMLIISLTGRKIMSKLNFFKQHAKTIRKVFGFVILLAVLFIAAQGNAINITPPQELKQSSTLELQDALESPYPAPNFVGIKTWLNSKPLTMESLKGKIVLIDFWTYSCINCVRTLPYITKWDNTYRDKGLVIIGIHSPEFEFEKNRSNVENALLTHNIKYPVAMDNNLDTWTEFKNLYWPAHYLIDRQGNVVYTHFGEGNYLETENNIRFLLGINSKADSSDSEAEFSSKQSPETYLGYERGNNFSSPEPIGFDTSQTYSIPKFIKADHWALSGKWIIGAENIISDSKRASLQFNFTAGKMFLVLGTKVGKPIDISLKLNGEPIGKSSGKDVKNNIITVDKHRLYELVNQGEETNGLIEITASEPGLEAYAFTFGK